MEQVQGQGPPSTLTEANHLNRLAFIRRARELGFSIEDVRELLDLAGHRENGTAPPFGRSRSSRPRMRRRPEPLKRLRPSGYDRCRKACGTNSASAWPALLSGVSLAARSMMGFGELARDTQSDFSSGAAFAASERETALRVLAGGDAEQPIVLQGGVINIRLSRTSRRQRRGSCRTSNIVR